MPYVFGYTASEHLYFLAAGLCWFACLNFRKLFARKAENSFLNERICSVTCFYLFIYFRGTLSYGLFYKVM